ncbi:MAG: hypothetical protein DRQ37_05770 [Gammaproteobacteria bacterium]|nr:MAG: hypothetical protein DRQ37_05770 [Gammaproteobacteria bacterium]
MERADSGVAVIIPFNARHFAKIGKSSQAELTGPGEMDANMVVPKDETVLWEFPLALSYCVQQLNDFIAAQRDRKMSAYRHVLYERAEHLPGAFLGRPMTTLSGMRGTEIVLPDRLFGGLISDSEKNIDAYLLLKEIGLQCLENGQIDVQPAHFRDWFIAVTAGV